LKNNLFNSLSEVADIFTSRMKNSGYDEASEIARAIKESLQESMKPKDEKKEPAVAKTQEKVQEAHLAVPQSSAPLLSSSSVHEARVSEEWEKVEEDSERSPLIDPVTKWQSQLQVLNTIGLNDNVETNLRLLEEEKGDLERVVARIISLRA
jgi:glycine cleavage system protein P-like pyridoxal-binding family